MQLDVPLPLVTHLLEADQALFDLFGFAVFALDLASFFALFLGFWFGLWPWPLDYLASFVTTLQ